MSALWAAAVALAELDAASAGVCLLSRPLVLAPAVGAALGEPGRGAALGAALEIMSLRELPLGGSLSWSAAVAAGTGAVLSCGPAGLPVEAGFWLGVGTGFIHAAAEARLRQARSAFLRAARGAAEEGRPPRLGSFLAASLAGQWAATFILVWACLRAGPLLWEELRLLAPGAPTGARWAFLAAPWAALGALSASLARRPA